MKLANVLLLFLYTSTFLWAQHQDEMARADQLFAENRWEEAAATYGSLALKTPENGKAWLQLGLARYHSGAWRDAAQALSRAEALAYQPTRTQYHLARAYAKLNQPEQAFACLEKAVAAGFNQPATLQSEEAFESVQANARFKAVLAQAKRNESPCEANPKHREFDFWLGTWDVFSKTGQKAGVNTITKEENGCMIHEKWMGASGKGGSSMNFYDSRTNEWVQVWQGLGIHIHIRGGLKDGSMVLTGHITYYNSDTHFPFRGTWTPLEDGRVRQFFEQSNDEGKTWTPWFEGFYQKQ